MSELGLLVEPMPRIVHPEVAKGWQARGHEPLQGWAAEDCLVEMRLRVVMVMMTAAAPAVAEDSHARALSLNVPGR